MIKSRAVLTASAVFLSTALAVNYIVLNKKPEIKSSQVLTWDCEIPTYKPESIIIYCGDGGAYIDKITWNNWSKKGARGIGEYHRNLCEPNCADGKLVHAPVTVRLTELTPRKDKYYLRTLDMSSTSGKDFPWGESGVFEWDVMEFAEMMDWD